MVPFNLLSVCINITGSSFLLMLCQKNTSPLKFWDYEEEYILREIRRAVSAFFAWCDLSCIFCVINTL